MGEASSGPTKVTVCIATADRPDELRRLLHSVAAIEQPARTQVEVLVVDNGQSQRAFSARRELTAGGLPVSVISELRAGIPFARNALVEHALAMGSDFIVFVDDDEVVETDWLKRMFECAMDCDADVVAGPVIPHFPPGAPKWAAVSGVYEQKRFPTGQELPWVATNNTLVAARVFREMDPWFEPRFAASGGSDFAFFRRVKVAGYRIAWCDDALVFEHVPSQRARLKWFVRRCLRTGSVRGAEIRRGEPVSSAILQSIRAVAVAAAALVLAVVESPRGWKAMRRIRQSLNQIGMVAGLSGYVIEEYRPRRRGSEGAGA